MRTLYRLRLPYFIVVAMVLILVGGSASCGTAGATSDKPLPLTPPAIASSFSPSPQNQAKLLMARYDLHPKDLSPTIHRMKLENERPPFQSMISASGKIGYDLKRFIGKEVDEFRYTLKQKTQSGGDIDAVFLCSAGNIIGAFLVLTDYFGGVSSLPDHSQFAPQE